MRELGLRSPAVKVGGIVYFGRLIDKIRQHTKGQLPSDYQANLGRGFDSTWVIARQTMRFTFGMNLCESAAGTTNFLRFSNAGRKKPAWRAGRRSRPCSPSSTPTKAACWSGTKNSKPPRINWR